MSNIKYSIPDENGGYKQVTRDEWEEWICDYSQGLYDANRLLLDVARAADKWVNAAKHLDKTALNYTHELRAALSRAREAGIELEEDGNA